MRPILEWEKLRPLEVVGLLRLRMCEAKRERDGDGVGQHGSALYSRRSSVGEKEARQQYKPRQQYSTMHLVFSAVCLARCPTADLTRCPTAPLPTNASDKLFLTNYHKRHDISQLPKESGDLWSRSRGKI